MLGIRAFLATPRLIHAWPKRVLNSAKASSFDMAAPLSMTFCAKAMPSLRLVTASAANKVAALFTTT
jgi:hypothetical protein